MGLASLAGRSFRLDPSTVSWNFTTKVSDTPTVGGKVVQVYGTQLSDMTLEGSFGVGGWRQQEAFLEQMKEVGNEQIAAMGQMRSQKDPHRFYYAPKDWDFLVYLKGYTSPDGQRAVTHDPAIFAPRWRLTLFIVEDNSGLTKVAQDQYLARLSNGLGWKQTVYSGPMTNEELLANLGGLTVEEYLQREFGIGSNIVTGNQ